MAKKRMRKKDRKFIIICLFITGLCLCGIGYYYLTNNEEILEKIIPDNIEKKKLTIVDEESNERPIAVMYDNNVGYNSHVGLQDSYLNYEMIVEGGLTRIMALFKDKDVSLIGPVRSSRHYFLDYALESDAIYCHYGWSDYAKNDINSLGVNNINGLTDSKAYWRDKKIVAPHNVFTNIDTLYTQASKYSYNVKTSNWRVLNYDTEEVNLNNKDNVNNVVVNNISLKYSNFHTTSYQYDSDNKYYLRYMDGKQHIDKITGEQLHYKNIIVMKVRNTTIDSYGRQDLDTVGIGEGYYVTNGYATPIKWSKSTRKAKTIYLDENGNEIKVNDGNTFIQIIPITTTIELS